MTSASAGSADKTADEIKSAFDAGKLLVVSLDTANYMFYPANVSLGSDTYGVHVFPQYFVMYGTTLMFLSFEYDAQGNTTIIMAPVIGDNAG